MFTSIKEIVGFAKSGAKLAAIAASVLQNNKQEGLTLLREETIKAALAASLWNSPLKLLTVLDTVKSGKKTILVKQWLQATTELSRNLPVNASGDVSRITDETTFVMEINNAIGIWDKDWTDYEASQKTKIEARATKTTPTPTPTPTPTATTTTDTTEPVDSATVALANSAREILELREKLESAEMRLASALRIARERETALETANEKIKTLEAELAALRATQSPPTRKRVKKETTA